MSSDQLKRAAVKLREGAPVIAEPLAVWLESWDGIPFDEHGPMPVDLQHALNVARAILGEAS